MARNKETFEAFTKRLARGPAGEAIVVEDATGANRYVYTDGTWDEKSKVPQGISVIEVAGCIALENVTVLEELPEAGVTVGEEVLSV